VRRYWSWVTRLMSRYTRFPLLHWGYFAESVAVFLIAPVLIPLVFEWGNTGTIRTSSVQLILALMVFSSGAASRFQLVFVISVIAGLLWSGAYAHTLTTEISGSKTASGGFGGTFWWWATILVGAMFFLYHVGERYIRHVWDGEPFFAFSRVRRRVR
jgi:heme/copper-type cytochrome/quinol oxidase subunit 3